MNLSFTKKITHIVKSHNHPFKLQICVATLFTSFLIALPSEAAPKKGVKVLHKEQTVKVASTQPATPTTPATTPYAGLPLDIDVLAREVYMIDYDTGAILLEKDATKLMHPSSMTKIMTAYLVVYKIKTGVISRDTVFTVSKNGWRVEGSSMFLNINDQVKVGDLLKGLIIQSGNDSSVILAENIAGSEAAFAKEMTRCAHEMGAKQTNFLNASGLPLPGHMTTAKDLAIISARVIKDQPEFYGMYSEKEFTYGNIKQGNRNPLLSKNMGCDGIKTGHSQIAGYGIVASCVQDGKRLVLVINGLKNMNERSQEAQKLITWGFRTFVNKTVATNQQVLGKTKVAYGATDSVQVLAPKALIITIPKAFETDMKITYNIPESVDAPVVRGSVLGKATVTCAALKEPITFDLVADADIAKAGFIKRIGQKIASIFGKK